MLYVLLVIIGMVPGVYAHHLIPNAPIALKITYLVIGVIGSLFAGTVGNTIHKRETDPTFHPASLVYGFAGALILVAIATHIPGLH
jgi:uncharacterized membrane protein YeaQ/YmgE (transglycosylase-associated protein family)